ncbi:MAG: hypothetical protein GVY36_14015 [Verrucomicrobia bacterium]|jgi:hypothetical protein|nr:hypothetical protein [Verrucomicrobiota bacterium]
MADYTWCHPVDHSDQWDGFNDSGIEHFRANPVNSVAREVIQNSIDALVEPPVKVCFHRESVKTDTIPGVDQYREIMEACRRAAESEDEKAQIFFENAVGLLEKTRITVLRISDFNTKGLEGPSTNGTPFYAYLKAKGQSRKPSGPDQGGKSSLGSYGIGKFAPYAASALRTIFVSTVYKDENGECKQLTQGKSILMSHDRKGNRHQATGFYGVPNLCKPIEGAARELPKWIQREHAGKGANTGTGTDLAILGFEATQTWKQILRQAVFRNFFGAIYSGALEVEIDDEKVWNTQTISAYVDRIEEKSISEDGNSDFEYADFYLRALAHNPQVVVEESQTLHLGLVRLRILVGEGLPKKVCFLRSGMFITDALSGLKQFSDFKEFVAVVTCHSDEGNSLLRKMEPPRHDTFEPNLLSTKKEIAKGRKALRDLADWVRDKLKTHAKDPVSDVTPIDELKDFFADEGDSQAGSPLDEVNPLGEIVIRAKPISRKSRLRKSEQESRDGEGGDVEDSDSPGGGGKDGSGGGDGMGGSGEGEGGAGKQGGLTPVELKNVRCAQHSGSKKIINFSPDISGQIRVGIKQAGADADYAVRIRSSDKGETNGDGTITVDVERDRRISIELMLEEDFDGAMKVVAYAV